MSKFRTVTLPFTHRLDQSTPWEGQTGRIVPDLPAGPQNFWGIPFEFDEQSLLVVGEGASVGAVELAIDASRHSLWLLISAIPVPAKVSPDSQPITPDRSSQVPASIWRITRSSSSR